MKKGIHLIMGLLLGAVFLPGLTWAAEASDAELRQELQRTRERLEALEKRLDPAGPNPEGGIHEEGDLGVKSLEDRIRTLEEQLEEAPLLGEWARRFTLSGLIEVEAFYEDLDVDDPAGDDADTSDLVLATVELGVDVEITRHVGGHVLLLWEEDETEPVDIDEAFIILDGGEGLPLYLNAGKLYVPFGYFESHFISDPLTLELGETNESAILAGYVDDRFELAVAVFNGDVDETGEEDHLESVVASARFRLPADAVTGLGLALGASCISNIADSDALEGETPGEIDDYVPGLGAFVSLAILDRLFLEAEYIGALDGFEAGELAFDAGEAARPKAWNVELACIPADDWEVAIKYEGSDDLGDFLPEEQYGAAVAYRLFENTALALEYLRGEFENDDERDLVTAQLAIEF